MTQQQFILHIEGCQATVRRFLTALCCGDAALADDLAQDTFVKAYLARDDFRADAKFSSWIYRIAYNTFLSSRRTSHITESIDNAVTKAADERADSGLQYQELHIALAKLSDKERAAIVLHYLQGYAVAEIATIAQTSPNAVKQLLMRGRRHLKEHLTN